MAQAYFFSVLGTFFDRFFLRSTDPTMTFVLVGRVQPEYLLAKGLFLRKNWAVRNLRQTKFVQQEETNCVFLQFIFKQTFTKRNTITFTEKVEPVRPFTKESTELFITRRKWISVIRRRVRKMQDVGEFLMRYFFRFFKESDSSSDKRWATNTLPIRVKHEEVRVCSSNVCTNKRQ